MFTGLVEEIGRIERIEVRSGGRRIWIGARRVLEDARLGDSLAVDGVCLTVAEVERDRFSVDAVPETIERTTLGGRREGDAVNLERSLRLDQRLGGPLVQGDGDGVGKVARVIAGGGGKAGSVELPKCLARFVAEKGSLAVGG